MPALRNAAYALLAIAIGAGIGIGVFYAQRAYGTRTQNPDTTSATPTPQASAAPGSQVTYTNAAFSLGLPVPAKISVLEEALPDFPSTETASQLSFLSQQTNQSLAKEGTVLYLLKSSAGQAPSADQKKLRTLAMTGLHNDATYTDPDPVAGIIHRQYLDALGASVEDYEITAPSFYAVITRPLTPSTTAMTATQFTALLTAVKGSATSSSPTPSPAATVSPSATYLLNNQ